MPYYDRIICSRNKNKELIDQDARYVYIVVLKISSICFVGEITFMKHL